MRPITGRETLHLALIGVMAALVIALWIGGAILLAVGATLLTGLQVLTFLSHYFRWRARWRWMP